jgi:phthalate 4,5-dioxygenase oxygenase subunit
VHDQWACESMGPIQNRTREHLGTTDKGIVAYRRMLLEAIDSTLAGEAAPMLPDAAQASALTGPPSIDGVTANAQVDDYCHNADLARRRGSDWACARLAA